MADSEDFYSILGVDRNATGDEIHKAWRKLAMKYHPDRNHGDKEAEEKLKKINVAHDVLSDEKKRQVYDQIGHDAFIHGGANAAGGGPGGMHFDMGGMGDLDDLFGGLFGMGGGRRRKRNPNAPEAGADLQMQLEISFREAVFGVDKEISINRHVPCESCHGSGCAAGTSRKSCPHCNGTGTIVTSRGFFSMQTTCPHCGGTGQIVERPCAKCGGSGFERERKTLTLHIPAGVNTGVRLRSSGNGEAGKNGGPFGDLYIVLVVREDSFFQREGDDLFCSVPISFPVAVLGGEISIPTLDGEEKLTIPEGTQHGTKFRMKKKGVPSLRKKGSRGDLYVQVQVEVPVNLGKAQKEKLKEFADSCSQNEYPKLNAFLNRIRNLFS